MEGQYNLRSPAVKRLMREAQELVEPNEQFYAQPLEDNLFEWHFTIRGPVDSEFEVGVYHGRIILPPEYPMKPPSIILLTPNGRFETNKKICLSISGHHPESWQPSWSLRTALLAIIGFMPTHGNGAIGSLDYTADERKILAKRSLKWECPQCGAPERLLRPVTEASKALNKEAKELGSLISLQGEKEKKEGSPDKPVSRLVQSSPSSSSLASSQNTDTTTTAATTTPSPPSSTTAPPQPQFPPFPPFDPSQMFGAGRFPMMPQMFAGGGCTYPPQMYNGSFMTQPQVPYGVPGSQNPYGLPSGFSPTPQFWMPGMMMPGFPPGTMMPPVPVQQPAGTDVDQSHLVPSSLAATWQQQALHLNHSHDFNKAPTMMAMSTEKDYTSQSSTYAPARMRFSTNTSHSEACAGQPNSQVNDSRSNAETSGSGKGHTGGLVPEGRRISLVGNDNAGVPLLQETHTPEGSVSGSALLHDAENPLRVQTADTTVDKEVSATRSVGDAVNKEESVARSLKDTGGMSLKTSVALPLIQANSPSTPCITSRQLNASFHKASTEPTPSGNAAQFSSFIPCTISSSHPIIRSSESADVSRSDIATTTTITSEITTPSQPITSTDSSSRIDTDTTVSEGSARAPTTDLRQRITGADSSSSGAVLQPSNMPAELPRVRRMETGGGVGGMLVHGLVAVLVVCILALLYRRLFLLG